MSYKMKHFVLDEFFRSHTAKEHGIDLTDIPNYNEVCARITALVENVLDPLREYYGRMIYVTSGFRTKLLNRLLSGADDSQHMKGEAADITTGNYDWNLQLVDILLSRIDTFDQVILERVDHDKLHYGWIHVSYRKEYNRHQVLKCYKGIYNKVDCQAELQAIRNYFTNQLKLKSNDNS